MPYTTRSPHMAPRRNSQSRTITDLLLRRGDIAAQQRLGSGQAMGRAVAGIGEAAGQFFGAKAESDQAEQQQAQRDAALTAFMQNYDKMEPQQRAVMAVKTLGPELGTQMLESIASLNKASIEVAQAQEELEAGREDRARERKTEAKKAMLPVLGMVEALGPQSTFARGALDRIILPFVNQAFADELQSDGQPVQLTSEMIYQPGVLGRLREALGGEGRQLEAVDPDKDVMDMRTGEVVREGREDPLDRRLKELKVQQAEKDLRADPAKPQPSLNDIDKLASRWKTATEPTREIDRQVKLMEEGLVSARRGDLAAGSQAILVTFQKILDPTSVVRESEYARSASGQSAVSRAEGIIDRLSKGGAGVPVSELEKFAELAKRMAKAGSSDYLEAERKRLGRLAQNFNIDPDLVFEGVDYTTTEEPSANPFRGGSAGPNPFR